MNLTNQPAEDARRVLVVDDQKIIADSLTAILCASGYQAEAAYSASGAINAAIHLIPNTVISDVLMPDMNGIELAEYFAEHHPDCTVLLMSGDSSAPDLLNQAALQAQPFSTRNKVVNPSEILALLAGFAPSA